MRCLLLVAFVWWVPAVSAAQGWVEPCDPGSGEARRAADALQAFHRRLEVGADLEALRAEWERVGDEPCLEVARETGELPWFESLPTFRAWWAEGGRTWLFGLLDGGRDLLIPPEMQTPLALDAASPALRALLCPEGDGDCGAATRGWRTRAESAFEAQEHSDAARAGGRDCASAIQRVSPEERWVYWGRCVAASVPRRGTLPLASFRRPDRGWLVLRGRRGHYRYCDEVRAYDLTTGAAHVARSCRGMALGADGSVDRRAQPSAITLQAGRVPLDNLREAAWMLFLAEAVSLRRVGIRQVSPPRGLRRRFRIEPLFRHGFGSGSWAHSGQTRLAWAWVHGPDLVAEGTLTWPDSARPGESHAARLIEIAEGGLTEGCVPAALPRLKLGTRRPGVSGVDADTPVQSLEGRLTEALQGASPPRCGASVAGSGP